MVQLEVSSIPRGICVIHERKIPVLSRSSVVGGGVSGDQEPHGQAGGIGRTRAWQDAVVWCNLKRVCDAL